MFCSTALDPYGAVSRCSGAQAEDGGGSSGQQLHALTGGGVRHVTFEQFTHTCTLV